MLNHARAVAIGVLLGAVVIMIGIWLAIDGSVVRGIVIAVGGVLMSGGALEGWRRGPPSS
jgi:hypothetical protein